MRGEARRLRLREAQADGLRELLPHVRVVLREVALALLLPADLLHEELPLLRHGRRREGVGPHAVDLEKHGERVSVT